MTDEENRLRRQFNRLLRNFQAAAVNLSWVGGADPRDHDAIEQEHQAATLALTSFVIELIKKSATVQSESAQQQTRID